MNNQRLRPRKKDARAIPHMHYKKREQSAGVGNSTLVSTFLMSLLLFYDEILLRGKLLNAENDSMRMEMMK